MPQPTTGHFSTDTESKAAQLTLPATALHPGALAWPAWRRVLWVLTGVAALWLAVAWAL